MLSTSLPCRPLPSPTCSSGPDTDENGLKRTNAAVVDEALAALQPALRDRDGVWTTGYVRLWFRAHLPEDSASGTAAERAAPPEDACQASNGDGSGGGGGDWPLESGCAAGERGREGRRGGDGDEGGDGGWGIGVERHGGGVSISVVTPPRVHDLNGEFLACIGFVVAFLSFLAARRDGAGGAGL